MPGHSQLTHGGGTDTNGTIPLFTTSRRLLSKSFPPVMVKEERGIRLRGPSRAHSDEDPFSNFELLSRYQRNGYTLPIPQVVDSSYPLKAYWRSLGLASPSDPQAATQPSPRQIRAQQRQPVVHGPGDYFSSKDIRIRDRPAASDDQVLEALSHTEAVSRVNSHHVIYQAQSLHYTHDAPKLEKLCYDEAMPSSSPFTNHHELVSYHDGWVHVGCTDEASLGQYIAHKDSIVIAIGGARCSNSSYPMLYATSVYFGPECNEPDLNDAQVYETKQHEPSTIRTAELTSVFIALDKVDALRRASKLRLPPHLRHVVIKTHSEEVRDELSFGIGVWRENESKEDDRTVDQIGRLINKLHFHHISVQFRLVTAEQNIQAIEQAVCALKTWIKDVDIIGAPTWIGREDPTD